MPSGYPDERVDSALLRLFDLRPPCTPDPRRANRLLRLRPELIDAEWTDAVRSDAVRTDAERPDAEYMDAVSEDVGGEISFPNPDGPWVLVDAGARGVAVEREADDDAGCTAISVSEACA